ncbi:MAG TPA: patatin-like phospholipase family protein [Thermoanaerobaculia bacterium]|nr:patatin-like phospholipase family protein [Thermoanaerobaculia bacterium]
MTGERERREPRVALVVGAGAIKCAAGLGVYRALEQAGIPVDLVVGCSGGSISAAQIALGWDAETACEKTTRMWTRELTKKRNKRAARQAAIPRLFGFDPAFGLIDDERILQRLREGFGDATFAACEIPLAILATDFRTGEKVILRQGSLVDAIRASIAIPFIFKPWPIGDRLLIDGALSDPMPVDVAIRERIDLILALGFDSPYQGRIDSIARFAFQVTTIMTNNLLQANFAFQNLAHHAEVIPVLPEFGERIKAFDTNKLPHIIECGQRAMEARLPYLESLRRAAS